MGFILDLLIDILEDIRQSRKEQKKQSPKPENVVKKCNVNNSLIKGSVIASPSRKYSVKRNITLLWQERNWKKAGNQYSGYYRTPYGSYQGEIIEESPEFIRYYIFGLPKCLSRHSHYACFIPKGGNKYEVHFNKRAKKVDEGIMAIEKILAEAHRL